MPQLSLSPGVRRRLSPFHVRTFVALTLTVALFSPTLRLKAAPAAGDLDPTFAGDGTVFADRALSDPNDVMLSMEEVFDMAVQPDGKVLVLALNPGYRNMGPSVTELLRFNADGSPDSTFGYDPYGANPGVVQVSFSSGNPSSSRVYGMALQPDGKIVVTGIYEGGGRNPFVARYEGSGFLDPTFSPADPSDPSRPAGVLFLPGLDTSRAVAVGDGKVYVAGTNFNPGGGTLVGISGTGAVEFSAVTEGTYWCDVEVDQNNRPVVMGGAAGVQVGRYNPDGTPDAAFGTNGIAAVADLDSNFRHGLAVSDGKILVAGEFLITEGGVYGTRMTFARLDGAGALDPTFGVGGRVLSNIPDSSAYSVAAQPDGKFVAAGLVDKNFGVARFNADGSIDTSFSGDGKDSTAFPKPADAAAWGFVGAQGVAVSGGKIVVAGVALDARLYPDPGQGERTFYEPGVGVARYLGSSPDFGALTLSAASVIGGANSVGTIRLNSPAPAGGAKVFLTSSDTAAATVPAYTLIGAGQTTRNFTVTTKPVAATASVVISAAYAGSTVSAPFVVTAPRLKALSLTASSICPDCQTASGTVSLTGKAPSGGLSVSLTSSNAAASVPTTVTVPEGLTTATFSVTASAVASAQTAVLKAAYLDVSFERTLNLTPYALKTFTLSTTSTVGPAPVTGTVTFTCPAPAGGTVVTLASSLRGVARPNVASITIPAGETTGTFTVETADTLEAVGVNITASFNGVNKAVKLTVN